MFYAPYFDGQYFPQVWFAPGDESAVPVDELQGGWSPPWQFIQRPQPVRPPQRPPFNEDEDTTLLFSLGVL